MTAQSKDQELEVGAPVELSASGVATSGVVIESDRNLDDRTDRRVDVSHAPRRAADALAQAFAREANRRGPYPSDRFPLVGATGETLASWQWPSDLSKIDGAKVKGIPGSALEPPIDGAIFQPLAFGDGDFEAGSITKDHLHQEVLDFIEENGGSQEIVGLEDFGAGLQAIQCNAEALPPAETVVAVDPKESQLTLPIWDTANHKAFVPTQFSPYTGLPVDDDPFDGKWMFGRRLFTSSKNEGDDHSALWTFDPIAKTATFEDDGSAGGLTGAEVIIPPQHLGFKAGFVGIPHIAISVSFRILEIVAPQGAPNLPFGGYEYGVSINRKNPGSGMENGKGHGEIGKFSDIIWIINSIPTVTKLKEGGGSIDMGQARGVRIQIQASKVTITDPVVRLVGISVDPEYRASERLATPTTPWTGILSA